MARIQWAKASQFNWVFDNMGGVPLMAAVAGVFGNAVTMVQPEGQVQIQTPLPGGGRVYLVRGVWRSEVQFPWDGFWAEPIEGELTNYYTGGFFVNRGMVTTLTLGQPLPAGTPVQIYYLYFTGEKSSKYEALNNYPCIRRAYRSREDYTYDFAVDRLLDLMVYLYEAEGECDRDFRPLRDFLWEAFCCREHSLTPPLIYDSFDRIFWDRGSFLLYRGATAGSEAFKVFQTELATGVKGRVLHVRADLPTRQDSAWCGYGLNWSLEDSPFSSLARGFFSVKGQAGCRRLHNLLKIGSGSANLVLAGDFDHQEKTRFVVQIETSGEVGEAACRWSKDGGLTWQETGVLTGDAQHPVTLWGGVSIYWEKGDGLDLVAGDYWTFWAGEPAEHPRRLLVTLNDSAQGEPDPWGPQHTYVHALPDRETQLTAFEVPFSQFWRRDNIIDDADRVRGEWGCWYSASQVDGCDLTISDREVTEVIEGDTFYTQRQVIWNLSPFATAFGVWVGVSPSRTDSTDHVNLNFLLKPLVSGANNLLLRIKVKDARGSYFYQDQMVTVNSWQRVVAPFASMALESGAEPLTHPIQAVDLGIPANPPSNGTFLITDLKFDEHLTFTGAKRLRVLEFKMEQQGMRDHEWWLDEVGLGPMEATDPYPMAPRLAVSLGPYGQNPWRGPTLVHYAHPLAPYLVGAINLSQIYVKLHRDAQDQYHQRYGGVKGPILPVHTRNDIENIALCGEENFGRFCWWGRVRHYGKLVAAWRFNGDLVDEIGTTPLSWSGTPTYTSGICQPGDTAISLDGTKYCYCAHHDKFRLKDNDFTFEMVVKFNNLTPAQDCLAGFWDVSGNNRSWSLWRYYSGLGFRYSTNGSDVIYLYDYVGPLSTGTWYHLAFVRDGTDLHFYINGELFTTLNIGTTYIYDATSQLRLGSWGPGTWQLNGDIDYFSLINGYAMSALEVADRWQIIQGQLNGSAYPEAGHALGQYWAFLRLAQYYFHTNGTEAWEILEHWLHWIDTFGVADGQGWKFPTYFSEYGFGYGDYDPGAAASLAIGCLYIYLRNGNETAGLWARRILDDLRLNRQSRDYGGGYKSDYHYAWLNALVAQAFALAVAPLRGQAFPFPHHSFDADHYQALMSWMFTHSGDVKPNLLNRDLIPFTYLEAQDVWDYAPHYVFMSGMGSLEAVVLMLGAALGYGKVAGDWTWFDRLLRFLLLDNLVRLHPQNISSLHAAYDLAGVKNLIRMKYADYDQDNSRFVEIRDEAAITAWGEAPLVVDCRYGGPVVVENPETANLLATRLLKRLRTPWETLDLTTWLEGARIEIGDTVAVSADFHGLAEEEFTVFGKTLDLKRRQVHLNLARPLDCSWAWAVETAGSSYDSFAIDQPSQYDANWSFKALAG